MKKVSESRFIKILSRYLNILEPTQKVREKQKKSSPKGECQNNNRVVACPFSALIQVEMQVYANANVNVSAIIVAPSNYFRSPQHFLPFLSSWLLCSLCLCICVYEKLNYNYNLNE